MPRPEQFFTPHRPEPTYAPQKGGDGGTHQPRRARRAARNQAGSAQPVFDRRGLLVGGGAALGLTLMGVGAMLGGRSSSEQSMSVSTDSINTPTRKPDVSLASSAGQQVILPGGAESVRVFRPEDLVRSKVDEILSKDTTDKLLKDVYSGGKHPEIDPVFKLPVQIGVLRLPGATAGTTRTTEYDDKKVFTFGGKHNWRVVKSIHPKIGFSEEWLKMRSDSAKEFIMMKEAMHLVVMTTMAPSMLAAMRQFHGVETQNYPISEREKEQTVMTTMMSDVDVENTLLLDFAAYLFMIPQYEQFKAADPIFAEDMKDDIINSLISEAQKRGIPYNKPDMTRQEVYALAFDIKSPWRNMVLEPKFSDPVQTAVAPFQNKP